MFSRSHCTKSGGSKSDLPCLINPPGNPPALPEDPRSLTAPGVAHSLRNVNRSKFTKGDSNESIRSAQAYNLGMQVSCGDCLCSSLGGGGSSASGGSCGGMRIKLDENIPSSLVETLASLGHPRDRREMPRRSEFSPRRPPNHRLPIPRGG